MAAQDQDQARLRRKLNSSARVKMARLAKERFRRPDLRVIEDDARIALAKAFVVAASEIPKRELEALKRHGYAQSVSYLQLPTYIYVKPTGSRTFKRPDGVEVTREGAGKAVAVYRPGTDDMELPRFVNWPEATHAGADRVGGWRQSDPLKLPRSILIPGTMSPHSSGEQQGHCVAELEIAGRNKSSDPQSDRDVDTYNKLTVTYCRSDALATPELAAALQAYYVAADTRILAERKLIVSAIAVIGSCTTYGQALDFWPEVEELEEAMFGKTIVPPAFSLVALTDEDKAALCANMASRGVAGAACKRMAA